MTHVPDFFERAENKAEDWYHDNVVDGMATCSCGNQFKFDMGHQVSQSAYSLPVCTDCYDLCIFERELKSVVEYILNKKYLNVSADDFNSNYRDLAYQDVVKILEGMGLEWDSGLATKVTNEHGSHMIMNFLWTFSGKKKVHGVF